MAKEQKNRKFNPRNIIKFIISALMFLLTLSLFDSSAAIPVNSIKNPKRFPEIDANVNSIKNPKRFPEIDANRTSALPHQRFGRSVVRCRVVANPGINVTIDDFKKYGSIELIALYVPKSNPNAKRKRKIKVGNDEFSTKCNNIPLENMKEVNNTLRSQPCVSTIDKIPKNYDPNLGFPLEVKCFIGAEEFKCYHRSFDRPS